MKKEYIKPFAEIIEFQPKDAIMDVMVMNENFDLGGLSGGNEGVEDW